MAHYDLIIQGGRYFDGSTAPSAIRSLAIKDGRIALISVEPLDTARHWPSGSSMPVASGSPPAFSIPIPIPITMPS